MKTVQKIKEVMKEEIISGNDKTKITFLSLKELRGAYEVEVYKTGRTAA
jgi:hypothetical protein